MSEVDQFLVSGANTTSKLGRRRKDMPPLRKPCLQFSLKVSRPPPSHHVKALPPANPSPPSPGPPKEF